MTLCVKCGEPIASAGDTLLYVLSTVDGIAHIECPRQGPDLYSWTDAAISERLGEVADRPENRGTSTGTLLVEAAVRLRRPDRPPERVISAEEFRLFSPDTRQMILEAGVLVADEIPQTERAGSVADGNSNTPRGAVVESGVQPDAGEVDAEFESRPGPLAIPACGDAVGDTGRLVVLLHHLHRGLGAPIA